MAIKAFLSLPIMFRTDLKTRLSFPGWDLFRAAAVAGLVFYDSFTVLCFQ
jgi:hypothetical protein